MFRWLRPFKLRAEREAAKKHDDALRGRATSGHLTPGERQRAFRQRRKEN